MQKILGNQPISVDNSGAIDGAVNTIESPLTTDADGARDDMAAADSIPGKAPAFQFYPKDFLTDPRVVLMSMPERGVYITLLCYCWTDGTLPSDPATLARLCGMPVTAFRKFWPALETCFRPHHSQAGRLIHPRLELERRKQRAHRRERSEAGKRGADKRWLSHSSAIPQTTTQPMARDASSSSSAISNLRSSDFRQQQTDARSKRPIYQSDRFVVFEWMFDDLSKTLGPHFEAFDLHAFFDDLSRQSRESGLVIPRADAWPWLQAQVLAEAQRRKLPMASVVPVRDKAAEQRAQDEKILAMIQGDRRAGR